MSNIVDFPSSEKCSTSGPKEPPVLTFDGPQPFTVEAGVPFAAFVRALYAGGFTLAYDQRTETLLVRRAKGDPRD